jgi:hypothetical protein
MIRPMDHTLVFVVTPIQAKNPGAVTT